MLVRYTASQKTTVVYMRPQPKQLISIYVNVVLVVPKDHKGTFLLGCLLCARRLARYRQGTGNSEVYCCSSRYLVSAS